MAKSNKRQKPNVHYEEAKDRRFQSKEEAWRTVGPLYAKIVAQGLKKQGENKDPACKRLRTR